MSRRSLVISVYFYQGRYFGAEDGFERSFGWPPSPGRLFQALVAGAAKGARLLPNDGRALQWLESLEPPSIVAPACRRGKTTKFFVPNNDLDAKGGDPTKQGDIRVAKTWRACFFDHEEPVVFVWEFGDGLDHAKRVCAIAHQIFQLGRGVDPAWASAAVTTPDDARTMLASHSGTLRRPSRSGTVAVPHAGTLASLLEREQRRATRLSLERTARGVTRVFRQPPKASFRYARYGAPPHNLLFEVRDERGFVAQPIRSVAMLTADLRERAAARLAEATPSRAEQFERLIIGRGASPADIAQRVRVIPIPSIGTEHTDPSIRRILVEAPPDCPIRTDDLKWSFAGLEVGETEEVPAARLVSTNDSSMVARFNPSARTFQSITAVALPKAQPRHQARRRNDEGTHGHAGDGTAGAVLQALRHAGIDDRPTDVRAQREPFRRRGVRAEYFAEGSRFSRHDLRHVQLRFAQPLMHTGLFVIGNGRFSGLGLMAPVRTQNDLLTFSLADSELGKEHRREILHHLRRALMSRAKDSSGRLGTLFSGHEPDGRSDQARNHAHVFFAADGGAEQADRITRLIVAAPWSVHRHRSKIDTRFDEVVRGLTDLRAGRLGRFSNLVALPVETGDPLVGPARSWVTYTSYVATRHPKGTADLAVAIKADVALECRRRNFPVPDLIEVTDATIGPRGGSPKASVHLRFRTAIEGPLMLGRDCHTGGGLFHAQ